jgi:hypothetical protein
MFTKYIILVEKALKNKKGCYLMALGALATLSGSNIIL